MSFTLEKGMIKKLNSDSFLSFPLSSCVDNVTLVSVEVVRGKTNDFMQFHFERETEQGTQKMKHGLFKVQNPPMYQRQGESTKDCYNRQNKEFFRRLLEIGTCYGLTEEALVKIANSGGSFQSMANDYINALKLDGTKVYVKTINNKGFIDLPAQHNHTVIQNMNDGPCTLSYDKYQLKNLHNIQPVKNGVSEEGDFVDEEDLNF